MHQQFYILFYNFLSIEKYDYTIGVDPGVKTWIAAVRRGKDEHETNIKISSKQWYYAIKQNTRNKKAEKMTERYENAAKADREKYFERFGVFVSPKGTRYLLLFLNEMKNYSFENN